MLGFLGSLHHFNFLWRVLIFSWKTLKQWLCLDIRELHSKLVIRKRIASTLVEIRLLDRIVLMNRLSLQMGYSEIKGCDSIKVGSKLSIICNCATIPRWIWEYYIPSSFETFYLLILKFPLRWFHYGKVQVATRLLRKVKYQVPLILI